MNTKNAYCAANGFSVSRMTGYGIPAGKVQYHSCRVFYFADGRMKFLKPTQYDTFVTREEAERIDKENGRLVQSGRNTGKFDGFVQSRAARKRGYMPTGRQLRRYEQSKQWHEAARKAG